MVASGVISGQNGRERYLENVTLDMETAVVVSADALRHSCVLRARRRSTRCGLSTAGAGDERSHLALKVWPTLPLAPTLAPTASRSGLVDFCQWSSHSFKITSPSRCVVARHWWALPVGGALARGTSHRITPITSARKGLPRMRPCQCSCSIGFTQLHQSALGALL